MAQKAISSLIHSKILIIVSMLLSGYAVFSQISPGDLADVHAHLEGISNCTKCHILGEKVSNDKCLECHTYLKERIDQNKGYHVSSEVRGFDCFKCHSDHHGRKFEMIRFDTETFNHDFTGYELSGAHANKMCRDCHKPAFILDKDIRKRKNTFLGLQTNCLSCHNDYHQETLGVDCASCHDFKTFKPASGFNHDEAKFILRGKHRNIDCIKCHKTELRGGIKFQQFTGIEYNSCASCHKDVHNNKFGQNCVQCHSEESFHIIKGLSNFDHSKTDYPLEGKHIYVDCKECHKSNYTNPIQTGKCTNCHIDYHKKQFVKQGISPDCSECHTVNGFSTSLYTLQAHNESQFPLQGAHLATPCFVCHKKTERWEFRDIGIKCIDCHDNVHKTFISEKFYPEATCESCHNESRWSTVKFEHSTTEFELKGKHKEQSCRACHFRKDESGVVHQQFSNLGTQCTSCHKDIHYGQFEKEGHVDCFACHDFNNWKADKFDHDQTNFRLDGAHEQLTCKACHKPAISQQFDYILYKIDTYRCEDCHK
ncbi:MAG: cytochrome C [Bacteroidetes bacterium]|nr:cytochrome C [Bacteroidota bacterium]